MNLQGAAPLVILTILAGGLPGVVAIKRCYGLISAVAGLGLVVALLSIPYALQAPVPALPAMFTLNALSLGFIGLILVSGLLILILAAGYWQAQTPLRREEYPLLFVAGILGAAVLAAAANFMMLFIGLETMTLAMIGMIAYPHFRPGAEEAGMKYLVLSGMSSSFVLFGIGLIELSSGSLNITQIIAATPADAASREMLIAGLAMIAIGTGFKLSVVPFHIWVPDVYAGAPAPTGAYVAVIAKLGVLAVLIRVINLPGVSLPAGVMTLITVIAILSMLAGNLLALMQDNLKRILGYSSIAHLGYLLVAMLAAGTIGQVAVVFYIVAYAITMIGAFGVIAVLSRSSDARDIDKISELRGLFWTRPALAAVMTLFLLSLAGIPPALGFIAKMYIMAAGVHTQLWGLLAVMVVSGVIGLFYYLNIILMMSMKPHTEEPLPGVLAISIPNRLAIAMVSLPILAFGVAPSPLIALLKLMFN
ncbi:MAG: NADH-quinone oxidoreductase subunit N [Acidocella sp.]|nr:NADH-quinone oxidoreductase subunit N [Acidocella sp.]MDE8350048.1 NADH-quinone oxidoreductase subunit N [Acidocella sp.]